MISGCKPTPQTCRRVRGFVLKVRAAARRCRPTLPGCGELQEHLVMSVHAAEGKIQPSGTSLEGRCEYQQEFLLTLSRHQLCPAASKGFYMLSLSI